MSASRAVVKDKAGARRRLVDPRRTVRPREKDSRSAFERRRSVSTFRRLAGSGVDAREITKPASIYNASIHGKVPFERVRVTDDEKNGADRTETIMY